MNWIELHTNTRYSDVLSFIEPKQMVSICAKHGCRAVAITDRNTVQAYLAAEREAAKRGIALIYGLTVDCLDRDDMYAVTLLTKNMKGRDQIFDLLKLLKENETSFGRCVTRQQMEEHRDGLLIGASAMDGQLVRAIQLRRSIKYIKKAASRYDYIELPLEPYDVSTQMCRVAMECHIPVCAVQNATLEEYCDSAQQHAYCAIAHFWGKQEEAACYMLPEDLAESFQELYILPEEQSAIQKALEDGPQQIASMIEPMPSIRELLRAGRIRRHKNCMDKLREDAMQKLEQQYGQAVKYAVRERLDWELKQVDRAGAAGTICLLQEIRAALTDKGRSMMIAGTWNSSFLLYLLGIINIDPLPKSLSDSGCDLCPASLFCTGDDLLSVEIRVSEDSVPIVKERLASVYGEEMVAVCPTNRLVEDDELLNEIIECYFGERCDPEEQKALREDGSFFWHITHGASEEQVRGAMPLLCWVPDQEHLPPIQKQENDPFAMELDYWGIDVPHIRLLSSKLLNVLEKFEQKTGVRSESIPLDSPEVFQTIVSEQTAEEVTSIGAACLFAGCRTTKDFSVICDALKVHDVGSLSRALSLDHGTGVWLDNQSKLYQDGKITAEQIICCREDVYRYLTARGVAEEEAASYMKEVYMGTVRRKGLSEVDMSRLKHCEAEDWFISVCQKVDYLFPESHSVAYAMLMIRLVWYVLRYPDMMHMVNA